MHFDTSRNQTFDAVMAGKYKNIRMYTVAVSFVAQRVDDEMQCGTLRALKMDASANVDNLFSVCCTCCEWVLCTWAVALTVSVPSI